MCIGNRICPGYLAEVLAAEDLEDGAREHLSFLHECAAMGAELCSQLNRYMELYMEADRYFENGISVGSDMDARCKALIYDANEVLEKMRADGKKAFDPLGGIMLRREELFEFVAYCAGQIIKSLETESRVPEDRKPLNVRSWW